MSLACQEMLIEGQWRNVIETTLSKAQGHIICSHGMDGRKRYLLTKVIREDKTEQYFIVFI